MDLEVCYAAMGGDLDGVRGRLLKDDRIARFAKAFLSDGTFESLEESLDAGDLETAFRAAHTLKGTSRDLGFTSLFEPSSQLADLLRPDEAGVPAGPLDQVPSVHDQVKAAYADTVAALQLLD